MSDGLRKKMSEAMLELFVNAQIHSETKHIYTCGQFFPKRHRIEFCIADTGIGFKENFFRRFEKTISAVDAIRWAVQAEIRLKSAFRAVSAWRCSANSSN